MERAKGHGLADLRGVDPMDRRIEIEKKERYARELRDQMSGRSRTPGKRSPSDDAEWLSNPQSGASSRPTSGLASTGACVLGTPPRSPMPMGSNSVSIETGKAESWGTAGKVSQLQSLIHDRLKYLEDQQRQYWEQLQVMDRVQGDTRQEAAAAAREAAETVIHKQCGILREEIGRQAAKVAQETAANVAAEAAASAAREAASGAAREAAIAAREAAAGVAREAALNAAQEAANVAAQQIKRDMQIAQEEALRNVGEKIQQSCKQDLNELRARINQQGDESARVKSACDAMKEDFSKIFRELERLERVKVDREEFLEQLNKQKGQLESSMADLRRNIDDDIRRAVRDAVRSEAVNMKPREPAPKKEPPRPVTPEPTPEFKQAPKETYVILKASADSSVHYLCDLENTLGRSNVCSAMVGQSQSISNQHASISVSGKGAVLRDLDSRNGTWLNDRRVGAHEGLSIESGDAIQLGVDGPSFLFEWGPAAAKLLPREYQSVRSRGREDPSRSRTPVRSQ